MVGSAFRWGIRTVCHDRILWPCDLMNEPGSGRQGLQKYVSNQRSSRSTVLTAHTISMTRIVKGELTSPCFRHGVRNGGRKERVREGSGVHAPNYSHDGARLCRLMTAAIYDFATSMRRSLPPRPPWHQLRKNKVSTHRTAPDSPPPPLTRGPCAYARARSDRQVASTHISTQVILLF